MSSRDETSISAFGAIVLWVIATALMLGLPLALSGLISVLRGIPFGQASAALHGSLPGLTLVQLAAMGVPLALGLRVFGTEITPAEALHMRPVKMSTLAFALLSGACLQFPLTELSNLLRHYVFGVEPIEHQIALQNMLEARSLLDGMVVVTCLVALVPATEELFCRGFLLFALSNRYGRGFGLLLSSFLFGALHLGAVPAVYASVAGLLLGTLALWTRSVWPGIAVHAAINAIPVLLPERLLQIHGFNVPSSRAEHLSPLLVWPPLAVGLALMWLAMRTESETRDERE